MGKANAITSCLSRDITTSVGGTPVALDFHLGVEMSSSAICPSASCCSLHLSFPIPHPHISPRALTSSFLSSEEKERDGTCVLLSCYDGTTGVQRMAPALSSFQASPEEEGRNRTGVFNAAVSGQWEESGPKGVCRIKTQSRST